MEKMKKKEQRYCAFNKVHAFEHKYLSLNKPFTSSIVPAPVPSNFIISFIKSFISWMKGGIWMTSMSFTRI